MRRRDDMTSRNSILLQIGDVSCVIWQETLSLISFIGEAVSACADAVRRPRKIRWRETLFYMNMCGSDGLPIPALICFLAGIILGYQCAVQMHKYGADAFLPGLVGCSVVRELGPMMVAIVATGRAGSAFAAEIGEGDVALTRVSGEDLRPLVVGTQPQFGNAPVMLLLAADLEKFSMMPRDRALCAAAIDTGGVMQNVLLFCAANGLGARPRLQMDKDALAKALALPAGTVPMLNVVVGKAAAPAASK